VQYFKQHPILVILFGLCFELSLIPETLIAKDWPTGWSQGILNSGDRKPFDFLWWGIGIIGPIVFVIQWAEEAELKVLHLVRSFKSRWSTLNRFSREILFPGMKLLYCWNIDIIDSRHGEGRNKPL
jgi:hypothetical protein